MKDIKEVGALFYKDNNYNFRIFWNICFRCPLNCKYCSIHDNTSIILDLNNTLKIVDKINYIIDFMLNKNINCKIVLSGGEPTEYPNFIEVLNKLKSNNIMICTNLYYSESYLRDILNTNKIKYIETTYHPEKVNKNNYIKNIEYIKNNYPNIELVILLMYEVNYEQDILMLQKQIGGEIRVIEYNINNDDTYYKINNKFYNKHNTYQNYDLYLKDENNNITNTNVSNLYKKDKIYFKYYQCEGIKYNICINYNGDIFPCVDCTRINKNNLGNILDNNFNFGNYLNKEKIICLSNKCRTDIHFPKKRIINV